MEKDDISKGLGESDLADSCQSGVNDAATGRQSGTGLTQSRSGDVRGITYFIRVGDTVKIGFASNLKRRLGSLQTSHSEEMEVLAAISAADVDEYATHQKFAHLRIHAYPVDTYSTFL